jgi:hypothetical protein
MNLGLCMGCCGTPGDRLNRCAAEPEEEVIAPKKDRSSQSTPEGSVADLDDRPPPGSAPTSPFCLRHQRDTYCSIETYSSVDMRTRK